MFVGRQNFPGSAGCNVVNSKFYFVKITINKCVKYTFVGM